jgi:hypothetical protein
MASIVDALIQDSQKVPAWVPWDDIQKDPDIAAFGKDRTARAFDVWASESDKFWESRKEQDPAAYKKYLEYRAHFPEMRKAALDAKSGDHLVESLKRSAAEQAAPATTRTEIPVPDRRSDLRPSSSTVASDSGALPIVVCIAAAVAACGVIALVTRPLNAKQVVASTGTKGPKARPNAQVPRDCRKVPGYSWKSAGIAFGLAFLIYVVVGTITRADAPVNLGWTVVWMYLSVEAWKVWRWGTLLPYPILLVAASVATTAFGRTPETTAILAILNIVGLAVFYAALKRSTRTTG